MFHFGLLRSQGLTFLGVFLRAACERLLREITPLKVLNGDHSPVFQAHLRNIRCKASRIVVLRSVFFFVGLILRRFLRIVSFRLFAFRFGFLGLVSLTETTTWPRSAAALALELLGIPPVATLESLEERGLVVSVEEEGKTAVLHAHPALVGAVAPRLPEGEAPRSIVGAHQIREADGLELVLRLAALWQRLEDGPLRQKQQGPLYKRDRDRLEEDAGLTGPIADALEPLPDPLDFLVALGRRAGLVVLAGGGERLDPAPAEYWVEHGVHLPHVLATAWLGLTSWHEIGGAQEAGTPTTLALPFVRPVVLLWLARVEAGHWVALEDLAFHLRGLAPGWSRLLLGALGPSADPERLLAAMLLGPAYQLGLVRAAEEVGTGRRVVQLTELGRYVLGVGPHPEPRPSFPQFLYVQPNFELIAYRQGLTPGLIGQLARFARWTNVGAALELKLTAESIYRGLEGGLTADAILDRIVHGSHRIALKGASLRKPEGI